MYTWLVIAVGLAAGVSRAGAVETDRLAALLRAAEEQSRPATALRADGEFIIASPEATRRDQIILLYRPTSTGCDLYIELRHDGGKALLLANGAQAFRLAARARQAEAFLPEATLAGSDFAREDFELFRAARFTDARISDESATQLTAMLAPQPSQYSLEVVTFDPQRKVPTRTLYYRETVNNLVKMQRNSDHVQVGGRWWPGTITMEDFKLRTLSTLTLTWTQNPTFPPELFDPAALPRPSGLRWP